MCWTETQQATGITGGLCFSRGAVCQVVLNLLTQGGKLGLVSRLASRLSRSASTPASLNIGVGSGPRRASRTPQELVEIYHTVVAKAK